MGITPDLLLKVQGFWSSVGVEDITAFTLGHPSKNTMASNKNTKASGGHSA